MTTPTRRNDPYSPKVMDASHELPQWITGTDLPVEGSGFAGVQPSQPHTVVTRHCANATTAHGSPRKTKNQRRHAATRKKLKTIAARVVANEAVLSGTLTDAHHSDCVELAKHEKCVRFRESTCEHFKKNGRCNRGAKCLFAHGEAQLRTAKQNVADGLTTPEAICVFQTTHQVPKAGLTESPRSDKQVG